MDVFVMVGVFESVFGRLYMFYGGMFEKFGL